MNLLYVGVVSNTHGIKGEIRIKSDFSDSSIYSVGSTLYILDTPLKVVSYRRHKDYDMVSFEGINNIDKVLKYKGEKVYIDKDNLEKPVIEDLIGFEVYSDRYIGKVISIIKNIKYFILVLDNKNMIPYIDEFITSVDYELKKITIKEIEGLINEN